MHGLIFSEIKKYVDTKLGGDTWKQLLNDTGLSSRVYTNVQVYPDAEAVAIVSAASKRTGTPAAAILEDFGQFISSDLLGMYPALIRPEWKTLEVLENVEDTIHSVVRARQSGAQPAQLSSKRSGPSQIMLTYNSPRKMCPVAKGIITGLGQHFHQRLSIDETACMHRGAAACTFVVNVL